MVILFLTATIQLGLYSSKVNIKIINEIRVWPGAISEKMTVAKFQGRIGPYKSMRFPHVPANIMQ